MITYVKYYIIDNIINNITHMKFKVDGTTFNFTKANPDFKIELTDSIKSMERQIVINKKLISEKHWASKTFKNDNLLFKNIIKDYKARLKKLC